MLQTTNTRFIKAVFENLMIRYVTHNEINKSKWDNTIHSSFNKLPYAYSWYLDIVSPDWDALIYGDYKAIMPLTGNRKFGISYLYQPPFSPQLGVFSVINNDAFCIDDFIKAIPNKFKLIEIAINSKNFICDESLVQQMIKKVYHQLPIDEQYENIRKRYKANHIKNIDKFSRNKLHFEIRNQSCHDLYRYKLDSIQRKGIRVKKKVKKKYLNLLIKLEEKNCLKTFVAYDMNKTAIGGAGFIRIDESIMIQTFSYNIGRKYCLIFFLIDQLIKENSGQKLTIDFMGSSLEGVKYRNIGFGCFEDYYTLIKINRLNKIFRIIKN